MAKIHDIRHKTPRTNGTRPLSRITHIARHHSATTSGSWETFWPYWRDHHGWGTGGYHEIILRDGSVQLCYDPKEITNGVANQNSYIYHICVVGNGSFTQAQEATFSERCRLAMERLNIPVERVLGHREFPGASTTCPGINMDVVRERLRTGKQPAESLDPMHKGFLVYGERGMSVKKMAEQLAALGYNAEPIEFFNTQTKRALMDFQSDHGLTVDGSFGPASQAALKKAIGEGVNIVADILKLSTKEGANARLRVLRRFENKDPALAELWRKKAENGEFTVHDGLEVLFVAIDRGYITGLVDTSELLERVEALEKK